MVLHIWNPSTPDVESRGEQCVQDQPGSCRGGELMPQQIKSDPKRLMGLSLIPGLPVVEKESQPLQVVL